MFTLFHHPFCPHSRFIRLALGEYGLDLRLAEERTWERREAFLALNPAGTKSSPNISMKPMARGWMNGGCCHQRWGIASRCAG